MTHTAGKWSVTGQSEGGRYITVQSDNGRTVARVPWNTEKEANTGRTTDHEDARLIAAAPDMLARLKGIAFLLDQGTAINGGSVFHDEVIETIAKATGQ